MQLPRLALALAFFAACVLPSSAQIAGELSGRVLDPSGAGVAHATVVLVGAATGIRQTTVSTDSGDYVFINLYPGSYRMKFPLQDLTILRGLASPSRPGKPSAQTFPSRSAPGSRPSQSMTMHRCCNPPPAISKRISPRPSSRPCRSTRGILFNWPRWRRESNLPPGTVLPRINGGRPRTNEYLFDGISALQPEPGQVAFFPILDDIQEFTVEANNVPAEFGRFNGGVVNVATRSGTNALHGSLFGIFSQRNF